MNFLDHTLEVLAVNAPWYNGVQFLIKSGDYIAKDIISEYRDPSSGKEIKPTFILAKNQTQQLMDSLWQCGFRPTEGTGSAGSLAATEKHLQDMRTLVFGKQGIK